PRPSGPSSPTRQLLDELDALMQQMLRLPVNQLEEDAAAEKVSARQEGKAPAEPQQAVPADASPSRAPEPVRTPPPVQVRFEPLPAEDPPAAEPPPATVSLEIPPAGLNPPVPLPTALAALRPVPLSAADTAAPQTTEPSRGWLAPVVGLNAAFDRCTLCLGTPGSWLRGDRGRKILGWLGLALLGVAAARVLLGWMGWTW